MTTETRTCPAILAAFGQALGYTGIVEMAITLAIVAVLLSRGVIKDTEKDLGPGIKGAINTVTHPTTETLTGEVRALKEQLIKLQSAKQTA